MSLTILNLLFKARKNDYYYYCVVVETFIERRGLVVVKLAESQSGVCAHFLLCLIKFARDLQKQFSIADPNYESWNFLRDHSTTSMHFFPTFIGKQDVIVRLESPYCCPPPPSSSSSTIAKVFRFSFLLLLPLNETLHFYDIVKMVLHQQSCKQTTSCSSGDGEKRLLPGEELCLAFMSLFIK